MSTKENLAEFYKLNDMAIPTNFEIDFIIFKISLIDLYEFIIEIKGLENLKAQPIELIALRLKLNPDLIKCTSCVIPALLLIYRRYLYDFNLWMPKRYERKSRRANNKDKSSSNMVSLQLANKCEEKCEFFGLNCIYSALACGLPNEIDLAIVVLLQMSIDNECSKILCKMKSISILLPAILGIFSLESKKSKTWLYLKDVPSIRECLEYIERQNTNIFPTLNSHNLKHSHWSYFQEDPQPDETIHSKFTQVLLILSNLIELLEYKVSVKSPVITLLLKCIESNISTLSYKAYKLLERVSSIIIIRSDCYQRDWMFSIIESMLLERDREKIILALKIIINITTSDHLSPSVSFKGFFSLDIILELLACYDSQITLLALKTLQVLTVNDSLSSKCKAKSVYLNLLAKFLTEKDMIDAGVADITMKKTFSCIITDQSIGKKVITWLDKNYTKEENLQQITLYDIFMKMIDEYRFHENLREFIIYLLEIFEDYTPLLKGTLEIYLKQSDKTLDGLKNFLLNTTFFYVPYSPNIPSHIYHRKNTLHNIQLLRMHRQSKSSNLIYLIKNIVVSPKSDYSQENKNYLELADITQEISNENTINKDMDQHAIYGLVSECVANILANMAGNNIHIRRYIIHYKLEKIIERNYDKMNIMKIICKILY